MAMPRLEHYCIRKIRPDKYRNIAALITIAEQRMIDKAKSRIDFFISGVIIDIRES